MDLPDGDTLIASAASFLIDGGEEDAASVLLSCTLHVWPSGDSWYAGDEIAYALHVELTGPRAAHDVLGGGNSAIAKRVQDSIEAVLPSNTYVRHFTAKAELVEIDPDWRSELLEIARGRRVDNQGTDFGSNPYSLTWNRMKFRSRSETKIAEALDQSGVLFLPNCLARLGQLPHRANREPDFLICHRQKWGILEVDGEPFHPPSRTTQEQERDRLFKAHGVRVVEHFDANRCYQDPDGVVREFLRLLEENG